jgi:hypothetical protein
MARFIPRTTLASRQRELAKIAALSDAIAAALGDCDVPLLHAAAQVGMTATAHAPIGWLHDERIGLAERCATVRQAL